MSDVRPRNFHSHILHRSGDNSNPTTHAPTRGGSSSSVTSRSSPVHRCLRPHARRARCPRPFRNDIELCYLARSILDGICPPVHHFRSPLALHARLPSDQPRHELLSNPTRHCQDAVPPPRPRPSMSSRSLLLSAFYIVLDNADVPPRRRSLQLFFPDNRSFRFDRNSGHAHLPNLRTYSYRPLRTTFLRTFWPHMLSHWDMSRHLHWNLYGRRPCPSSSIDGFRQPDSADR